MGSKEIYELLTRQFGSFYSHEWRMPNLNVELSKVWIRAYFDCEAWVTCEKRKNRNIGLDSVNKRRIHQIAISLARFGIKTKIKYRKKRKIYRLYIFGKENLMLFSKFIGFFHPTKRKKLDVVLNDFVCYGWKFPEEEVECKKFIGGLLMTRLRVRNKRYLRITSKEEQNLLKLKRLMLKFYGVECLFYKRINGLGTIYYEININKKSEMDKQ